jgi:hypothetical protein
MKTTQTYTLSRFKQLIDLNEDLVNFELSFQVESLDGSDFLALVVDQEYLDKEKNLEYKEAPGSISGNIVSDQNEYRNYFLVLKSISDENVDVRVTVEIEEIEARKKEDEDLNQGSVNENVNPRPGHPPTNEQNISKPQNEKGEKSQNNEKTDTKQSFFSKLKSKINLKLIIKILVFLAVIGGMVYVYFKYFYKTKGTSNNKVVAETEPPSTSPISGGSQSYLINKQNITSQNRTPTSLSPFTTPKSMINTIPKLENFPNVELSNPPKIEIESELPKVELELPKVELELPKVEFELPNTSSSPKSSSPTSNLINNAVKLVSQVSTPTKHSMPPTIPSINQNLFNRLRNLDLKA